MYISVKNFYYNFNIFWLIKFQTESQTAISSPLPNENELFGICGYNIFSSYIFHI